MQKFILPIILIASAVFIYYLFISPTYADVNELKAERAEYNEALENADQLRNKISSLRRQLNSFPQEQVERLDTMLPDNNVDNVRFILELNAATQEQGMELESVSVQESNNSRSDDEEEGAEIETTVADFSTEGTYEQLLALLSSLESSLRIVDIQSVELQEGAQDQSAGPNDINRYDISVQTYSLKY